MPKTKKSVADKILNAKVTYRLHLTDSNNHAVFLDVKLEDISAITIKTLVDIYKKEIADHGARQKASVANDKKVSKVADEKQKAKQKELEQNEEPEDTEEDFSDDPDFDEDEEI